MVVHSLEQSGKISEMRKGGQILSTVLREITAAVQPGITTDELDRMAVKLFKANKVDPAFLGYQGFPRSICASINEEIVHGIPGDRVLKDGNILSIDIGLKYKGYYSDMATTIPVGEVSGTAADIISAGKETLQRAVDVMEPGLPLRVLSRSIQEYAESRGYNVLRKYVGHAIGKKMHEEPQIPNFVNDVYPPESVLLEPGMVIAIEPMLTEGTYEVEIAEDGWTVFTADRKLSVHFEYSIAILDDRVEILTFF